MSEISVQNQILKDKIFNSLLSNGFSTQEIATFSGIIFGEGYTAGWLDVHKNLFEKMGMDDYLDLLKSVK
jgi:hypothetical protein